MTDKRSAITLEQSSSPTSGTLHAIVQRSRNLVDAYTFGPVYFVVGFVQPTSLAETPKGLGDD